MSGFIDKRKRSREEDVLCDSTPLSKRINNLHLDNYEDSSAGRSIQANGLHDLTSSFTTHLGIHGPDSSTDHHVEQSESPLLHCSYNPDLNETDNPFYYLKNKLLHELHFERLKRCAV